MREIKPGMAAIDNSTGKLILIKSYPFMLRSATYVIGQITGIFSLTYFALGTFTLCESYKRPGEE